VNEQVEALSGEIAAQLKAFVDPASVPWRFSTLRARSQSGLHYHMAAQDQSEPTLAHRLGTGPGRDMTKATLMGSCTHAILLDQPFAVFEGGRRAGKAWDDFAAEHPGVPIVNPRELATCRGIADAVRRHPKAHLLLLDTVMEQRIDWEMLGRRVRSTPDARARHHIAELKTTRCAEPIRFGRDAMFRAYHAQVALYCDAVLEAGLGTASEAYIFAVENAPPFACTVLRVHGNTLEQGRRCIRLWAEMALGCERSGEYPGYVQDIVDWDIGDEDPFTIRVNGDELEVA
jgi:hypothetical protein